MTVWHWPKNRHIGQWNRIDGPEIHTHTYGYLSYDKGGKNIQWRKDSLFNKCFWENCIGNNIKWRKDSLFNKYFWENWIATCKRMKVQYSLTSYKKIKWIKDLNIRPETVKDENIAGIFFDLNHTNMFPSVS